MRKAVALGALVWMGGGAARADQCAWVTEDQAKAAAERVHPGDKVRDYCEPCNDKAPGKVRVVKTVEVRKVKGEEYWELSVNGQGTDFAYLFVESKEDPGRFFNVANLSGCPAEGVSPSIKTGR